MFARMRAIDEMHPTQEVPGLLCLPARDAISELLIAEAMI